MVRRWMVSMMLLLPLAPLALALPPAGCESKSDGDDGPTDTDGDTSGAETDGGTGNGDGDGDGDGDGNGDGDGDGPGDGPGTDTDASGDGTDGGTSGDGDGDGDGDTTGDGDGPGTGNPGMSGGMPTTDGGDGDGDGDICGDILAQYNDLVSMNSCNSINDCKLVLGQCTVGLGDCYHAVNEAVSSYEIQVLGMSWAANDCGGAVCDCPPPPDGDCINNVCTFL